MDKRTFLHSINYFRGISILFIMAGHAIPMGNLVIDSYLEECFAYLVTGGTSLFVFISGFLFHHVFYAKFNYKVFMIKKVKNVLVPYLALSAAVITYYIFADIKWPFARHFFTGEEGIYHEYIRPMLMYLWTGRMLNAYWYIPFIMVIFAASPLFLRYIRLRPVARITIMLVLAGVSVFLHRPTHNMSVFQSVFYFTPMYLFGIIASMHRDVIYGYFKKREIYLIIAAVLIAWGQAVFHEGYGAGGNAPFAVLAPDLMIFQKMALCLFFMVFLNRFEGKQIPALHYLATASFAVYFLHAIVMRIIGRSNIMKSVYVVEVPGIIAWIVLTLGMLVVSLMAAKAIKSLFRSRSKYIIGY